MTKSSKNVIATAFGFAAATALLAGLFVYPAFRGLLKDASRVQELRLELLRVEEDRKAADEFAEAAKRNQQALFTIQDLFVDGETPIALFRFLDEAASSLNVQLQKAPGVLQKQAGDLWPSLEVRLAGEGAYPSVLGFFQKLENAPYLVRVRDVVMVEKAGAVGFSFTAKVFTKE